MIEEHKHCLLCAKVVESEKEFCSEKCKKEWDILVRKKRNTLYMYILMSVGIVLLLMLGSMYGR